MRPKKYLKSQQLTITIDDKDKQFLDDHRGKMTRGDYLIEGMYALKNETSNRLKDITEKYKQISQENHDLKRQLMFSQSRTNSRLESNLIVHSDMELERWYEENKMKEHITNMGRGINWQNVFDKNIIFFSARLKDHKELEKFCLERFKNNGSKS